MQYIPQKLFRRNHFASPILAIKLLYPQIKIFRDYTTCTFYYVIIHVVN